MGQLTVKQALEQGYKYCYLDDGETGLIHIEDGIDFTRGEFNIAEKESNPYQIADDQIKDLIVDMLSNQDEVADEDGELPDLIENIDYSEITATVNNALSVKKYYRSADIILIP